MSTEDIRGKMDKNSRTLDAYESIVLKSSLTSVFVYIPSLLPEGVWLKKFNVTFTAPQVILSDMDASKKSAAPRPRWVIELGGYVYTKDPKQEIRVVNELTSRIKKEKHLSKFFSNVNLSNLQVQDMEGHAVVSFSLTCT